MNRTRSYGELRNALALSGCAICRVSSQEVERYVDSLLYEKVNDGVLRAQLREARGFCRAHAWRLDRAGGALGTAIIMRDVIRTLQDTLGGAGLRRSEESDSRGEGASEAHTGRISGAQLATRLSPQAPCPVCLHAQSVEAELVTTFVETMRAPEESLLAAYRESDGFCLAHLGQVLVQAPNREVMQAVAGAQWGIWARLEGELDELIRKNDYRYRNEPIGEEGTAWLRALAAIAGQPPKGRRD